MCGVKQSLAMRLHVMLRCEFVQAISCVIPWIKDVDEDVPAIDEPEAANAAAIAAVAHDGDSDTFGWVCCCCCMIVAV